MILIPLAYNDGQPIPEEVIQGIFDGIWVEFGGFILAGTGWGAYRMSDGRRQDDECLIVWVGVPTEEESGVMRLKSMCEVWAKTLRQETIYFERTGAKVEFITSPSVGGLFK